MKAVQTLGAAIIGLGGLLGCSSSSDDAQPSTPPPPAPPPAEVLYEAELRITEYGVPHVAAADWGSLGFGHGYAYARDNYCVLMREVVIANGQSQRFFADEGSVSRDFVFALLGDDVEEVVLSAFDEESLALAEGYVAGFNRYLEDTGVGNLPDDELGCRDAPWVRPIDLVDYGKVLRKLSVRASTDPLADFIFAAEPPQAEAAAVSRPKASVKSLDPAALREAIERIDLPKPEDLGSNAYAVGSDATQHGRGALLGNPHFPWEGSNRFAMVHLTMKPEGEEQPTYNAMGAALHGFPLVSIGFNSDLAWTHTVSTGSRFVIYELDLNPDNPLQYEFEGEMRDITSQTISIEVQGDGGAVETREHTFYFSHFGPILDLGDVNSLLAGWPIAAGTGKVFTLRDINFSNFRGLTTWRNVAQSRNIAELETALSNIGIPWVNTIAADRAGTAFYGDISAIANVSDEQRGDCITGPIAPLLTDFGLTTLDGSRAACELLEDQDSPQPGVIGYQRLPKLINQTYVANANDSYWLSNPSSLLSGYPEIIGAEGVEQSQRTRLTFTQMEQRLAGTDGLGAPGVTAELLQELMFGSRNMPAELIRDDVVTLCGAVADWSPYSANEAAMNQACSVLAAWDGRHNVDSVGGQLFYEFWLNISGQENLWAVPFNAADPVGTPNTLNVADAELVEMVRQALADAVQRLLDNNIALDAPWGEVQFSERNGVRIPIHGGSGSMMFSVITSELVENEGYSDIRHGNSYMQTVDWDESDCPNAYALLSYSQSSHSASEHYDDQTRLYADKEWVDMAFCEAEIVADQLGETIRLQQLDE